MIPSFVASLAEAILSLYAGLMSFRAIQSDDSTDDKQVVGKHTTRVLCTRLALTVADHRR